MTLLLTACHPPPPKNTENICQVFRQYPKWYWAANDSQKRWGVPISVLMAVMHQESHFSSVAKPPREKLLWIIPWKRPSSAYGYGQALEETWDNYRKHSGHHGADRDDFSDAIDFVGWYANQAHRRVGLNKTNAYQVYLAYHEGMGGYAKKTYLKKPWLVHVAQKVNGVAYRYHKQMLACEKSLPTKPWWHW